MAKAFRGHDSTSPVPTFTQTENTSHETDAIDEKRAMVDQAFHAARKEATKPRSRHWDPATIARLFISPRILCLPSLDDASENESEGTLSQLSIKVASMSLKR